MDRPLQGLYVITDHRLTDFVALVGKTESILAQGICALQYRNKRASITTRMEQANTLQQLCHQYNTPLIINDDVEMAAALDCDGVHLGKDDIDCKTARMRLGEDKIIGVSCYNDLTRAKTVVAQGADYIVFGAMYPTDSKTDTVQATPDLLTRASDQFDIPIVAIGGITPDNCGTLITAGADMLAVIGSVYQGTNTVETVRKFNERFKAA